MPDAAAAVEEQLLIFWESILTISSAFWIFYFIFIFKKSVTFVLWSELFVLYGIPSPGDLVSSLLGSRGEDEARGLNNFFYCRIKKKKKAPFLTHWCLDTAKVPLHLSFSLFIVLGKICVQAFLSLGSAEESSRGFHALLTFVSSLWWCFLISPHREWVWSEVTEVIGFKCDKLSRGTFATRAALQSGSIWIWSCAIWD